MDLPKRCWALFQNQEQFVFYGEGVQVVKMFKLSNVGFSLAIVLALADNVYAFGLSDITNAAETLEAGQAASVPATAAAPVTNATAAAGNSLTGLLMQQLGVTQPQAEGGAGALFQLAKAKMQGEAFTELSNSVPGMQGLLAAAPVANSSVAGAGGLLGNLESLAGNSGGAVGNLVGLASSFQQLGLSPSMVQKFVPLVLQYVQGNGGSAVSSLLQSALMGGGS
jgi:hypothetical protein